ncbi:PAS domain S-box protein [Sphingomonas tabacisoli]|uniref:histidine kinase n=1 Tax=Sphingomonas tabacisoli TaxID=2249466 RepID=A0ABW4I105_9SPHN
MKRTTVSERALVLAPGGRDAAVACAMLHEAGIDADPCSTLGCLLEELDKGAALVVVTEEALATSDLHPLSGWIESQQEWSDLPFVLLTQRGGGLERNPSAKRYLDVLGNVTFLERPFHPTTLVSLVQSALRGRLRQYEARARLQALRDGEERYRTLFNSIDEGFCVIEFVDGPHGPLSDYVHVEANPAYERHAGIPNVVGQYVRQMVPDEADGWVELYGSVLRTGEPIRFERELVATGRHLEIAASRVEPPERRQVAVLFQDITHRREVEEALAASEAKFRAITDSIDQMIWSTTPDGYHDYFNQRWYDYTGVPEGSTDGEAWNGVFHPDDQERTWAVWRHSLTTGEPYHIEYRLRHHSGQYRWVLGRALPVRNAAGEIVRWYGSCTDIDDEIRAREVLAQSHEELERLVAERTAEREIALAQLHEAQKLETVGQLTGGVAHDFNNLLTPITGALDLLNRRDNDARTARLIDGALQSAERAKTLVQRLLGFARRQSLQSRPVDLGTLVESMRDLIASSIGPSVELHIAVAPDMPPAQVDPNQLELAVLNLCVNARDAMPDGGVLTVAVEQAVVGPHSTPGLAPGAYIRMSVIDTGIGMDESTLARAIEPFFSTKEIGRGTGLGLSMVHGLAAQLGGSFALSSVPGEGTRADLYLPLAPAGAHAEGVRLSGKTVDPGQPLSILLVDDEELVRAGTAEMLRDLGHTVTEAASGLEALAILGTIPTLDAVVTDYMMPRMNGAELAERLRERVADLPVLIITGYAGGDLELDFPQLAKPFRQADIAAALRRLTARGSNIVSFSRKR